MQQRALQKLATQLASRQLQSLAAQARLQALTVPSTQSTRASASLAAEPAVEAPSFSGRTGSSYGWLLVPAAAGAAVLGSTTSTQQEQAQADISSAQACLESKWVQQLASNQENKVVLSAQSMHSHPLLKQDHMFSELHRHDMVEDLVCFYNAPDRTLSYAIQLGKNVCGYPRIVHGGLTAAIIDEAFGFLMISLRGNRQLPFMGPAFTAHLEVDYRAKIQAGRLLLCTTEVESIEGRKLWMKATVRDGPTGKVYATARALFVCPRTQRLVRDGIKYALSSVFPNKIEVS
jgi:acyl-coenzyme A thioesterase PaaI-like protein